MASKLDILRHNYRDLTWWRRTGLPYLRIRFDGFVSQFTYSPSRHPFDLMAEKWENLLLLDACRFDLFDETNTLEGSLDYRISPASRTPEFLETMFADRRYHDTVYVTANPMYRSLDLEDVFFDTVDVWETHWDEKLHTVPPEAMATATIEAYEQYPRKRILSHFMQPHYPFIGDLGQSLGEHAGFEFIRREVTEEAPSRDNPIIWDRLRWNEVETEDVWAAYRENLELALPHVKSVLDAVSERTVVTSDHGNGIGERPYPFGGRVYGHPEGIRIEAIRKVPWFVVEGEDRKDIVSEPPKPQAGEYSAAVAERLENLGYRM